MSAQTDEDRHSPRDGADEALFDPADYARDVAGVLAEAYPAGAVVHFDGEASEEGFLGAAGFAGRDDLQVLLHGSAGRMLHVARFDNLGKGASGAAIQNMNIALGLPETTGLALPGTDR